MTGYRSMISSLLERAAPEVTALQPSAGPATQPTPSPPAVAEAPATEEKTVPNTESEDYKAGLAASNDAAKTAERQRFTAVMASEHYAGREKLAANLLGTEMSADAIISALADAPKAAAVDPAPKPEADGKTAAELQAAAEEAARQEMRDQMGKQSNQNLGNKTGDDASTSRTKAASVWDRAARANGRTTDKKD